MGALPLPPRSYRLTKKFRGLIELVELMSLPTDELLECWLLPAEELAEERGGLFASQKWRKDPQSLITKLLLHRDDPVRIPRPPPPPPPSAGSCCCVSMDEAP
jgi:hypothetical protein